jgi:tRNA 2-thiocytidine biosynthesis protein TtcA
MPPKLLSDDKKNIVIRPLAYAKEKDLAAFAAFKEYPIIPCNLCGSQEKLQRVQVKAMLREWETQYPGRTESIFRAMRNVAPSQLADGNLFDFESLSTQRVTEPNAFALGTQLPNINAVNL